MLVPWIVEAEKGGVKSTWSWAPEHSGLKKIVCCNMLKVILKLSKVVVLVAVLEL